jgi:hypothetical protein
MKFKLYKLIATACATIGTYCARASLFWIAKAKGGRVEASSRHPLLAPKFLVGFALSGTAGGVSAHYGIMPMIAALLGMLAMMTLIPKDEEPTPRIRTKPKA